jgi:GTP pyrophosphokinase
MIRFEDILHRVQSYQPDAELELLRRAYVFSARAHRDQKRASGEPYLVHPLEVASLLSDLKLDVISVAAGLLHDVVEDTLATPEEIEAYFGPGMAHLIAGVTKISKLEFSSVEEHQAENVRKMLLAMVDDIRIILIKLCDRLHNMRTLQHLPEHRRLRIAKETVEIYAPLAGRLGMGRIKNELEDLCFRVLEPEAHAVLSAQVESKRRWAHNFIAEIKTTIEKKLQDNDITAEVTGRTKRTYSIYQKMKRQLIELEKVYDFIALRIITDSPPNCYTILGIIHNTWRPVPGRVKDFIAIPRPNGYQSLHTSVISDSGVPFEIQIRTPEMHYIAEEGIAAHWSYKEGKPLAETDVRNFAWLRQILDWQRDVKDPREFLNTLKIDLYPEEVFCFTPKGEVRSFPRGATPVDFAYAIHTDIGHRCTGARVNGKMVPLRYRLKNGDIVEILTAANHHPSRDWLAFTATTRARSKIKSFINNAERQRSTEVGRKILEKEARRFGLNLKEMIVSENFARLLKDHARNKPEDLYAAIGYGKIAPRQVLARWVPAERLQEPPAEKSGLMQAVKRALRPSADKIKVKGVDDVLIYRAKCCDPIPGERITGFITRGKGVSVHRVDCSNGLNLSGDPDRRIEVEWERDSQAEYDVTLQVDVEDRKGILAAITSVISDTDINIRNVEARTFEDHKGAIDVTLSIQNAKDLERITRSIRSIDGVLDVARASHSR